VLALLYRINYGRQGCIGWPGTPFTKYSPTPFPSPDLNYAKLKFSPDGKQILLVAHTRGGEEVWLLQSKEVEKLFLR
jgi:hypothetical protein